MENKKMNEKPTVSYDPQAKAAYFKIREGKIAKTIEVAPEMFIDIGKDERLIGLEMLHPGRAYIKEEIIKISKDYNEPALKHLCPENLKKVFC